MSEIYVEGIREDIIYKFTKEFNGYGLPCSIEYDDSPIRDVIDETMRQIDVAFSGCVDDVFDLLEEELEGLKEEDKKYLIQKIKQITNYF